MWVLINNLESNGESWLIQARRILRSTTGLRQRDYFQIYLLLGMELVERSQKRLMVGEEGLFQWCRSHSTWMRLSRGWHLKSCKFCCVIEDNWKNIEWQHHLEYLQVFLVTYVQVASFWSQQVLICLVFLSWKKRKKRNIYCIYCRPSGLP